MATEVKTNEFAVLRYLADVPLHMRRHKPTEGRYVDYEAAEAALKELPQAAILQVEERSESWEEEVEDAELDQDTE
jgi:hypothetical protein